MTKLSGVQARLGKTRDYVDKKNYLKKYMYRNLKISWKNST